MIRMVQSSSAAHAKDYFSDALLKSDYYVNDQELKGKYHGQLARRLAISGMANKESFFALCENVHPVSGQPLTLRTKEDRTTGYDINFHCPKSVSILHALSKDDHILEAFQESVNETMQDIEKDSKTRVRKSGKYDDRETGELIWSDFVHQTSRPVDDQLPDPHLHSHCFVFNATWDDTEKQFKAAKFRDIKRDMPYYQARFHKRLSDKMIERGYQIERTDSSFEIAGVPKEAIQLFSKRSDEIGRVAKEKNINNAKQLDALGAKTRSKKQKGLGMQELKAEWKRQLRELNESTKTGEQGKNIEGNDPIIRFAKPKDGPRPNSKECVDHAVKHCFERASVMADRKLLSTAYRYALGNNTVSLNAITKQFKEDHELIHVKEGSRNLCTTKEVLGEERRMVQLARDGRNKMMPIYTKAPELKLNDQQAAAVNHVLTTKNRVSIIRGAAGTGKTTLMKEAGDLIKKAGKKVTVVAPTAQASRGVLKEEGFAEAETVARVLVDKNLQDQLQGQVLWVDEAGLLGTKDMSALLELTKRKNARLILGGDTRQHASVIRGDALRILNTVGGIETAEVNKIFRQKDAQYRAAVQDLSKGDVKNAFEKLDNLGSIKTVDPMKPNEELVDDYIKSTKSGKATLVISPTHKQGEEVTKDIREKMRQSGLLGKKEIKVKKLTPLNLTEAEKSDWRNLKQGQVVQFNQNMPGIKRGSSWAVQSVTDGKVMLNNEEGTSVVLPQAKGANFDVFRKDEIGLSKGDKIQITRNSFDNRERRLNNGTTLDVVSVNKNGNITLKNKASKSVIVVDRGFGHLAHAHCVTSHASQGKTVDEVFVAQPSGTFAATDARQFYVSVSRARERVTIYTDDRPALLDAASELGNRQSAMELVGPQMPHQDYVRQMQKAEYERSVKAQHEKTTKDIFHPYKERDYEPGF